MAWACIDKRISICVWKSDGDRGAGEDRCVNGWITSAKVVAFMSSDHYIADIVLCRVSLNKAQQVIMLGQCDEQSNRSSYTI